MNYIGIILCGVAGSVAVTLPLTGVVIGIIAGALIVYGNFTK